MILQLLIQNLQKNGIIQKKYRGGSEWKKWQDKLASAIWIER